MSYFCLDLGQTAEDSDMFTNIWLSSKGLKNIIDVLAVRPRIFYDIVLDTLAPIIAMKFR